MRRAALVLPFLLAAGGRALAQDAPGAPAASCTTHCHGLESTAFSGSAHARVLACTDCHGGDPKAERDKERSHAASAGFVGKIPREKIPNLCGDCHADPVRMGPSGLPTDQLAHYRTSNHGKALFGKGDTTVAVCTDCHGAHGILPAMDAKASTALVNQPATCGRCHGDAALMGSHGLSADVVERFKSSVHGKALLADRTRGAPGCSSCHGSHGAAPPGVTAVPEVCGHCHANTEEQFRLSAHARESERMQCSACHEKEKGEQYRRSGCAACHDHHATKHPDETMYSGREVGHCEHCHRLSDAAYGAMDKFRTTVLTGLADLRKKMQETRERIQEAKEHGLFLEGEQVYLNESDRVLVAVWPLSHSLDARVVETHLKDGLQKQQDTYDWIVKKSEPMRDRKIIYGGLVLFLLLLAGLFAVKLDAARRLT